MDDKVLLQTKVSPALRERLKLYAVQHGMTISHYVEGLIVSDLDKQQQEEQEEEERIVRESKRSSKKS